MPSTQETLAQCLFLQQSLSNVSSVDPQAMLPLGPAMLEVLYPPLYVFHVQGSDGVGLGGAGGAVL